ncbi:hypothetical protein [Persicirhabdus sediminis]|uniref:Uncharacterized protein n=1 Tax=Persicirhabdus sediminis TaxID=454144 RepID=A0A8J7SNK6_9BACT|nr:hypothetical protein [Persicirhabdus sediminis]MBK1791733.1 hypothetical protein [Persicirhabdus sediminis]
MKIKSYITLLATALFSLTVAANDEIPTGKLIVPDSVGWGSKTQVEWDIDYPDISDIVDIDEEDGSIEISVDGLRMMIRVKAAEMTRGDIYVEYRVGANGSWQRIFQGVSSDVQPEKVLNGPNSTGEVVNSNTRIDFRIKQDGYTGSRANWRATNLDKNSKYLTLVACIDGDEAPDVTGHSGQGDAADFIKKFIDEDGNVTLGRREVIYFFEAYGYIGEENNSYYDLQDAVILVTFE